MNDMTDVMKAAVRIVLIGSLILLMPGMAQDRPATLRSVPRDAEFVFGRTWIDIKARDSMVPRVDRSTIAPYAGLGLVNRFHIGRTDPLGRLRRLETWDRQTIESVPMSAVVAGKLLSDHDLPKPGTGAVGLIALFFVEQGSDWQQVSASDFVGEKRFIRLRWLKSLRVDTFEKHAERIEQSLSLIESFEYDEVGALVGILRQRCEQGFAMEQALIPGR